MVRIAGLDGALVAELDNFIDRSEEIEPDYFKVELYENVRVLYQFDRVTLSDGDDVAELDSFDFQEISIS